MHNKIPIEFSSPVSEVNIRKMPKMIDKKPCATALEGTEPRPKNWSKVEIPTPKEERCIYTDEDIIL